MLPNGKTRKFGIIGQPVSHSFSPRLHSQAFAALGENALYLPFPIPAEQLDQVLPAFRLLGIEGFNVTVPYKEKILPYLDQIDPAARLLGSVNTVLWTKEGWKGYSTDGAGLVRSLREAGFVLEGAELLLLGAGGSAKAVAVALAQAGVARLWIKNRNQDRAQELMQLVKQAQPTCQAGLWQKPLPVDLLINCTSVGMQDGLCPVDTNQIELAQRVADIIYNPPQTNLLAQAKALGKPHLNGLGMLLYQAVEAFELWIQRPAPVEVMRQSLEESLGLLP